MAVIFSDAFYTISSVDGGYVAQVKVPRKGGVVNLYLKSNGKPTLKSVEPLPSVEACEQVISIHKNEGKNVNDNNTDQIPSEDDTPSTPDEAPVKKKGKKQKGEKKTTEKKTEKKQSEPTSERPGVVAAIKKALSVATEDEPVSKEEILEFLAEEFPDRDPNKMKATINTQIHTNFKGKGPEVQSKRLETGNSKGYWLPSTDPKPKKKGKKSKKTGSVKGLEKLFATK